MDVVVVVIVMHHRTRLLLLLLLLLLEQGKSCIVVVILRGTVTVGVIIVGYHFWPIIAAAIVENIPDPRIAVGAVIIVAVVQGLWEGSYIIILYSKGSLVGIIIIIMIIIRIIGVVNIGYNYLVSIVNIHW